MNEITFRSIVDADKPFLLELYTSIRMKEIQSLGWTKEKIHEFMNMQFNCQWKSYKTLQFPKAQHLMILYKNREIGQVMIDRCGPDILIVDISILPEYRNQGIGSHVTNLYLDEGRKNKKPVRLHVDKYSPAFRFYKRLGFQLTDEDQVRYEMTWFPSQRRNDNE